MCPRGSRLISPDLAQVDPQRHEMATLLGVGTSTAGLSKVLVAAAVRGARFEATAEQAHLWRFVYATVRKIVPSNWYVLGGIEVGAGLTRCSWRIVFPF